MRRLFWRAGFGATPREARHWARRGKAAAIRWLLHGGPAPVPRIAAPQLENGEQLDPVNVWSHDAIWWLDRMVRSPRPLQEKLTLFWHDHFATSEQDTPLMLAQNRTLRRHALGPFPDLLREVTRDPAMLLHLSLADSDTEAPNENYARELMELYTLGRGYRERDIRQAARALTGFRADWRDDGNVSTYYDAEWHDKGRKRIFGRRGRFDWQDVLRLVRAPPRPRAVHHRQAVGVLRRLAAAPQGARPAGRDLPPLGPPHGAGGGRDPGPPGALPPPRRARHGQGAGGVPRRRAAQLRRRASTAATGAG